MDVDAHFVLGAGSSDQKDSDAYHDGDDQNWNDQITHHDTQSSF
jgi:hypothetical protein